jgi:hypothetical protein
MSDSKDTWDLMGKYFVTLTDLSVGYVKDVANEWAGALNTDDKGMAGTALTTMRETLGIGIRTSAKAWVATRQLMIDLAE